MTKRGIVDEMVKRQPGLSFRYAEKILNRMIGAMTEALERGERIEIRGFGSFGVKHRAARQGRNPRTGTPVEVEAKRIPFFRAGKELRVELNGPPQAEREPTA
jgi:integration host factor subunit beta